MNNNVMTLIKNWELVGNYLLYRLRKHHFVLAAIKGLRNGLVYGTRIRLPHAMVMVFLFGDGTFVDKLRVIIRLTRTHAINLGRFVFGYKLLTGALARTQGNVKQWHSAIAAAFVGYFIFGENNSVNMQINLYLLSRIIAGLARLAVNEGIVAEPAGPVFPWFAAGVWGIVLWLFEHHQSVLQPSLQSSMTYLYRDSERWTGIRDFLLKNE